MDDGELVASELVTNVVRRAHDPVAGRPIYVNGRLTVLQFGFCDCHGLCSGLSATSGRLRSQMTFGVVIHS